MTDTPFVIDYATALGGEVVCSPAGWVRHAPRFVTEGAARIVLDAIPDGPPWNDDPAEFDPHADAWAFAPWPGIAFALPLDE